MLQRTNQLFILFASALVSQCAFALTGVVIDPPGGSNLSYRDTVGTDTAVQNNSTVHTLDVSSNATWTGINLYGLYNSPGSVIDRKGFIVNTDARVYGGTAGIQNGTGSTIIATTNGSVAITNAGTIGALGGTLSVNGIYNNGTISSPTFGAIGNLGLITGSNAGIMNDTAGLITNTFGGVNIFNFGGVIGGSGAAYGIYNAGAISGAGFAIASSGQIMGSIAAIYNAAGGLISTNSDPGFAILNANLLGGSGTQYGIYNQGTISNTSLSSTGVTINNNSDSYVNGDLDGIYNGESGVISSLSGIAINNAGGISSITNAGSISGVTGGVINTSTGTINALTNTGSIGASQGHAIGNTGFIGAIINSGTIGQVGQLLSVNGIYNNGTIDGGGPVTIQNTGTITGSNAGILNDAAGIITNSWGGDAIQNNQPGTIGGAGATYGIYNAGTISTSFGIAINNTRNLTGSSASIYNAAGGLISTDGNFGTTISNSWALGGSGSQYGIYNLGTISSTAGTSLTIYNTGIIQGSVDGIYNGVGGAITVAHGATIRNEGFISSITNAGSITGDTQGINNLGTITTLTNTGSITAPQGNGIQNTRNIITLNNAQGGGTPLTYTGALPTNYNVIVNSASAYGKLSGSSLTGTTTFGVAPTSMLVVNTYVAVLSGFASANFTNQVGGTVSGLNWTLSPEGGSPTIWDLVVTAPSSGGGGSSPAPNPTPTPTPTPTPAPQPTNMTQGDTSSLASIGVTTNPVFAGGTLALTSGANTAQPFTVTSAGGTITTPSGSSATMTGGLSGTGPMTFNGGGTLVLGGASTYSGGTTVSDNTTVSIEGSSPLGTGAIFIASGSSLSGTGTIGAPVTVAGNLHPGNSPGYLALTQPITFNAGATYQQDIAGRAQASATSPVGATGYYSFLQVAGASVTINPGATLTPRLQNLFSPSESGYGSAPYVPVVGDKFRILTADGGITGKFTTLTQPTGLDPATQFISFYNYNSSNSLDLAVIPASFNTAVASASGNKNAQSVASALDKMVVANQASTSTSAQDALLYTASGHSLASLPSFTQGMAGEIYGATLAVVPQTSQRIQQAVISRLGDTMTAPVMAGAMAAINNTAISASNPGGQPTAGMSSNPNVNPYASGSGGMSMSNGAAWGEVAYQYGNRASDSNSGGWSSNLVQAVVGVDMYSEAGTKAGGGVALSNTNVSASQGSGTVQQGSLFLYGKLPVQQFVVDAMASYGFNSTNNSRNDATGITTGLQAKNVLGNDALVSLGLNLPIDLAESRVTPYIRATWQQVNQNGFNEGSAASALTVNSFNGNGVRGVIGVAAGSKALDPIKEQTTYRVNVGLGVDSTNVLNPQLNASLAGMTTAINTPSAGTAFVQAGMYGTVKFADNAFAYAGVTAEARSGQVLAGGNIGVRIQF